MTILEYIELFARWFTSPRVSGNLSTAAWVFIFSTVVLEFSKLKISPWTWAIKKFGKIMNAELSQELKNVNERLTSIEKRQDKAEHQDELEKALSARRRILRVKNDIVHGRDLDMECMRNVMADIASYEDYCEKHADPKDEWHFHNRECPEAIETLTNYSRELEKKLREAAKQHNQKD